MTDSLESQGQAVSDRQFLNSGTMPLTAQAVLLAFTRIVPNTSVRMIYPFLSVFAQGLGVGLPAISMAVSARAFLGMANPILGTWVDRTGRKAGIQLGLVLLIFSSVLVILFPGFPVFIAYLCLSYIGFLVLGMSIQSFIGDEVPYSHRGKIMSYVETSWAFSLIIAMPLLAVLLDKWGWRAPFPLLAILGLIILFIIHRYLPESKVSSASKTTGMLDKFKVIASSQSARMALLYMLTLSAANECVGLIFSVWITDSLGSWNEMLIPSIMALGLASIIIGVAELSGELLGGGLIDRLGKERSIFIGILCHAVSAVVLPYLGKTGLWGAYLGLFFLYLSFEFTMVASITFMSELIPTLRSTTIGTFLAFTSCGRMLGAWMVPFLYQLGFRYNAMAAFFISLISLFFIYQVWMIKKRSQDEDIAFSKVS